MPRGCYFLKVIELRRSLDAGVLGVTAAGRFQCIFKFVTNDRVMMCDFGVRVVKHVRLSGGRF